MSDKQTYKNQESPDKVVDEEEKEGADELLDLKKVKITDKLENYSNGDQAQVGI